MDIWKVPDLIAPANSLFFRLNKVFLFYLGVFSKITRNSQKVIFFLPLFTMQFCECSLQADPVVLYVILLPCHEAALDNQRVFKTYSVVGSSAWSSRSTLVMVWCKQGIIARSTDWIFCWKRPDWTQDVITVKTGGKSWLQRSQSHKWMESPPFNIYTFIHNEPFRAPFSRWQTE